jgi:hypothetical protein
MKERRLLRCAASVVLLLSSVLVAGQGDKEGSIQITAVEKAAGQPLVHFWSKVVGVGRANEGIRATWREELQDG